MKIYCQSLPIFPGGRIKPLDDSGHGKRSSHGVYGAHVASTRFLTNLLRHGHFDEYRLFVPGAILSSDSELREDLLGKLADDSRIVLKPLENFANGSVDGNYYVIHNPDGPQLLRQLSLRNRIGNGNLPVTAVTHTISYQALLQEIALLLIARPSSWDSIVCTSACGRRVLENLMTHVANKLKVQTGADFKYNGRLDVIPLGVDTELFKPREKRRLRRLLQLPSERLIFLWFGRFSIYDKADLNPLLIAFRKACDMIGESKPLLLLAGEDARTGAAETLAKAAADVGLSDNVLIHRNPSLLSGPLYYSASDVFICPSDNIQETFGQTIVEAMSSGLPVICSDWSGLRETVAQDTVGLKIPTYWAQLDSQLCEDAPNSPWQLDHLRLSQALCVDTDQMAEAIKKLAQDSQRREKMGTEARAHAVKNFDWRIVIAKYEELWETLNSVSAKTLAPKAGGTAWLKPSYVDHFKGFASILLTNTATVKTAVGSVRLPGFQDGSFLNRGLSSPLRGEIIDSILEQSTNGISIAELQINSVKFGLDSDDVTWYTLNLLKYGLLSLVKA